MTPVDLGDGFDAMEIVLGVYHCCALSTLYEIKCWGNNGQGKQGLGESGSRGDEENELGDYLQTVDLGANFVPHKLAAGGYHNCVIGSNVTSNHSVKCWGMLCHS